MNWELVSQIRGRLYSLCTNENLKTQTVILTVKSGVRHLSAPRPTTPTRPTGRRTNRATNNLGCQVAVSQGDGQNPDGSIWGAASRFIGPGGASS